MGNGEDGTQNGVNWQILDCRSEILAGRGKSLNRDDSPPQGLKPSLILHDLRGAKAPLYHSAAGFRDFFRSLLKIKARFSARPAEVRWRSPFSRSLLDPCRTSSKINRGFSR